MLLHFIFLAGPGKMRRERKIEKFSRAGWKEKKNESKSEATR